MVCTSERILGTVGEQALRAYLCFEEDHSGVRLEERSKVGHEARPTAEGEIFSPGARVRDMARL